MSVADVVRMTERVVRSVLREELAWRMFRADNAKLTVAEAWEDWRVLKRMHGKKIYVYPLVDAAMAEIRARLVDESDWLGVQGGSDLERLLWGAKKEQTDELAGWFEGCIRDE